MDVHAATISSLPYAAQPHLNYGETMVRVADGLPKFRDVPADFGGSGEMVPE